MVDPEEFAWISRMTEPCLSSETQTAERKRATVIGHVNEQSVSQFGVASFTNNLNNHYDTVLEGISSSSTLSFCPTDESATFFAVMNKISTLQDYTFFMYQYQYVLFLLKLLQTNYNMLIKMACGAMFDCICLPKQFFKLPHVEENRRGML